MAGGMRGRGACIAGETATAADGTHPTGMHYYRPQRSCGKVMFLHLSVSHSVQRVVCHHPLGEQTPPRQTPPLRSACSDTVNKRAARILLECILVVSNTTILDLA